MRSRCATSALPAALSVSDLPEANKLVSSIPAQPAGIKALLKPGGDTCLCDEEGSDSYSGVFWGLFVCIRSCGDAWKLHVCTLKHFTNNLHLMSKDFRTGVEVGWIKLHIRPSILHHFSCVFVVHSAQCHAYSTGGWGGAQMALKRSFH